jgi:hypothetical protein
MFCRVAGTALLRGVSLIADGDLQWLKGDLLLNEDSDIIVNPKGSLSVKSPVRLVAGGTPFQFFPFHLPMSRA